MADYKISCRLLRNGGMPEREREALKYRGLLPLAGELVTIIIKPFEKKRSLQQNSYWFAMLDKYVVPVFREAGSNWSDFDIHEEIMKELGYEKAMVKPNGEIVAKRIHSKTFDTKQWEEFMERGRAHLATEYHIFLPLPNESLTNYDR